MADELFPRPQNRGPIEARSLRLVSVHRPGFRGLKTAAPLKLPMLRSTSAKREVSAASKPRPH